MRHGNSPLTPAAKPLLHVAEMVFKFRWALANGSRKHGLQAEDLLMLPESPHTMISQGWCTDEMVAC